MENTAKFVLQEDTELAPLTETDAIDDTLYSQYMRKATFNDGSEAFITYLSDSPGADETGGDPTYGERAVATAQLFENLGYDNMVPEHELYLDARQPYLAVEAVDGYELAKEYKYGEHHEGDFADLLEEHGSFPRPVFDNGRNMHLRQAPEDIPEDVIDSVSAEEYRTLAGLTLLSGNSDLKGENMMIRPDGSLAAIDLDHGGGDATVKAPLSNDPSQFETHYDRSLGYLEANAELLGLDLDADDFKMEARCIASEYVDSGELDAEVLDGIENSSVLPDHPIFAYRDNIEQNFLTFADGSFPEYSF